jgi:hypothetical protein
LQYRSEPSGRGRYAKFGVKTAQAKSAKSRATVALHKQKRPTKTSQALKNGGVLKQGIELAFVLYA